MTFQSIISAVTQYAGANQWLVNIVLVIIGAILLGFIENIVHHRLIIILKRTPNVWDDTMINAMHKPLRWFIWLFALTYVIETAAPHLDATGLVNSMGRIRDIITAILILWFFMRYVRMIQTRIFSRLDEGNINADRTTVVAVAQIARVVILVIVMLSALQTLGISISALLAFGGVGGLAVGFAAKDTLANFLGGLMIFMDRPFSVGDWISSPDRQIEGTVEKIGWRLTQIRAFDKRPLYVPNGIFSTITIVNPSRMTNRRINTQIGVRYDDAKAIPQIADDIEKMLRAHPDIDQNATTFVAFNEFANSSLNLTVYTFTKTTQWVAFEKIRQDVYMKIMDVVASHGAEIAFSTTTLDLADNAREILYDLTNTKEA